jgi:hypothetical protein
LGLVVHYVIQKQVECGLIRICERNLNLLIIIIILHSIKMPLLDSIHARFVACASIIIDGTLSVAVDIDDKHHSSDTLNIQSNSALMDLLGQMHGTALYRI